MLSLILISFPEEWQRVIYVLLRKPRGDQRLVSKRRDIALMSQGMKLLCRMILVTAFPDMAARIHSDQMGWVQAVGAADASMQLAAIIDMARQSRQPLYFCTPRERCASSRFAIWACTWLGYSLQFIQRLTS